VPDGESGGWRPETPQERGHRIAGERWRMVEQSITDQRAQAEILSALAARVMNMPAHEAIAALAHGDRHAAAALARRAGVQLPPEWKAEAQAQHDRDTAQRASVQDAYRADLRHDSRVMGALTGSQAPRDALASVASDETASASMRKTAKIAGDLMRLRKLGMQDAIDETEQQMARPSRTEPGARFPGLAARLREAGANPLARADAYRASLPPGVASGPEGQPAQVSRPFPGKTDDDGRAHGWDSIDEPEPEWQLAQRPGEVPDFERARQEALRMAGGQL
jgi:hypothetical protein